MRFLVQLQTDKFPLAYRMMFVSMIKHALHEYQPKLYELYYEPFDGHENKSLKDYTFAVVLDKPHPDGDFIDFEGTIRFYFSTTNYDIFSALLKFLSAINYFRYKDFILKVCDLKIIKSHLITDRTIKLKTLSPLVIRDKYGKPVPILSKQFEDELNYIADRVLQTFRGVRLTERLSFKPEKMHRVVIKEKLQKPKQGEYFFISGWKGFFKLTGAVSDLQNIYDLGLGFRRSQGFGMIEIASGS